MNDLLNSRRIGSGIVTTIFDKCLEKGTSCITPKGSKEMIDYEFWYKPNDIHTDNDFLDALDKESKDVRAVFSYIRHRLPINSNLIELTPDNIIDFCSNNVKFDKFRVSKAIKRLKELNLLRSPNIDARYKGVFGKNVYAVNHIYLYKGNFDKLKKMFDTLDENYNFAKEEIERLLNNNTNDN